jgi:hypothetical protein
MNEIFRDFGIYSENAGYLEHIAFPSGDFKSSLILLPSA